MLFLNTYLVQSRRVTYSRKYYYYYGVGRYPIGIPHIIREPLGSPRSNRRPEARRYRTPRTGRVYC